MQVHQHRTVPKPWATWWTVSIWCNGHPAIPLFIKVTHTIHQPNTTVIICNWQPCNMLEFIGKYRHFRPRTSAIFIRTLILHVLFVLLQQLQESEEETERNNIVKVNLHCPSETEAAQQNSAKRKLRNEKTNVTNWWCWMSFRTHRLYKTQRDTIHTRKLFFSSVHRWHNISRCHDDRTNE